MDAVADHDARGEDIHAATATEALGVEHDTVDPAARSKAKMVNYGIAYGRDWLAAK